MSEQTPPGGERRSRPGRRALFSEPAAQGRPDPGPEPPVPGETARSGRQALFSSEPAGAVLPGAGSPGRWSAVVHCRTCLRATNVSLVELGLSLVPSIWLPTRAWPRLMRCPACHRVAWCRIDWPRLR